MIGNPIHDSLVFMASKSSADFAGYLYLNDPILLAELALLTVGVILVMVAWGRKLKHDKDKKGEEPMSRMTEFKGLKVPPRGLMCGGTDGIHNNCTGIQCEVCLFNVRNNESAYIEWLKYHDLTKIETLFGLLPD